MPKQIINPGESRPLPKDQNSMDMVRFRFRAYRQAMGWKVKALNTHLGSANAISKFETPGGSNQMPLVLRFIHELHVPAGFLIHGDLDALPGTVAMRVKAILDTGHAVNDVDVPAVLDAAGVEPINRFA